AQGTWLAAREREVLNTAYCHVLFTLPHNLGPLALQNPRPLYGLLLRTVAQTLQDIARDPKHLGAEIGGFAVLHTWGQQLHHHPHLHLLATSGGYDAQGARWEHLEYLPYALLRRKWQWHLLSTLRKTLATDAIKQLVDRCFRTYPNGLVTHVQKGQVPAQYQSVARVGAK